MGINQRGCFLIFTPDSSNGISIIPFGFVFEIGTGKSITSFSFNSVAS
jgi:hypothetical protein